MTRIAVVGDALLDRDLDGRAERLAPDAPVPVVDGLEEHARPGGAGLAAAIAAAAGGSAVTLVCALGADAAGERLRALLAAAGVEVCDLGLPGATPEKVRVRSGGRALMRLDYGGEAARCGPAGPAALAALQDAGAVLCLGLRPRRRGRAGAARRADRPARPARGLGSPPARRRTGPRVRARDAERGRGGALHARPPRARGGRRARSPSRGRRRPRGAGGRRARSPEGGALHEAPEGGAPAGAAPGGLVLHEARARALRERWRAVGVCVTLGARGALLVGADGPALAVPTPPAPAGDPCGAGDCFAATATARLAAGALPSEAVRAAVAAASAFVAAGGAAAWARGSAPAPPATEDAAALAARVRAAGGTVVATGGCFDLLHAGHVRTLEAARALGDCLIVCLNSDASVRRLKGPERPLVEEGDRAAVLAALGCVDAVAVFEEDDPRAILRGLRPHLWAKGGDYAVADLPEAATLREWGGRAVLVPYVTGRSTTHLIDEARRRAGKEVGHVR